MQATPAAGRQRLGSLLASFLLHVDKKMLGKITKRKAVPAQVAKRKALTPSVYDCVLRSPQLRKEKDKAIDGDCVTFPAPPPNQRP